MDDMESKATVDTAVPEKLAQGNASDDPGARTDPGAAPAEPAERRAQVKPALGRTRGLLDRRRSGFGPLKKFKDIVDTR